MGIDVEQLAEALDASRDVESIFKTVYRSDGTPVYLIDRLSKDDADDITDNLTLKQMLMDILNKGDETVGFEEELAKDVLEIITVFSAKLYGSRSKKNRELLKKLTETAKDQL